MSWLKGITGNSKDPILKFVGKTFGFKPKDKTLYYQALRHKSATVQGPDAGLPHYERLEYLGDAVLDALVADHLFYLYPEKDEGFLTKARAKMVSRSTLIDLALKVGLDQYLIANFEKRDSNRSACGDAMEAIIGAMYIEKGYVFTLKCVLAFMQKHLDLEKVLVQERDYKSKLIEWVQKEKKSFRFESEEIENGNDRTYNAQVFIDDVVMGTGTNTTKKKAEQAAAKVALAAVKSIDHDQ